MSKKPKNRKRSLTSTASSDLGYIVYPILCASVLSVGRSLRWLRKISNFQPSRSCNFTLDGESSSNRAHTVLENTESSITQDRLELDSTPSMAISASPTANQVCQTKASSHRLVPALFINQ